jgi:hypothetical protein
VPGQITLNALIPQRRLATTDGGTITLPTFIQDDKCKTTVRLYDTINGKLAERSVNVRSVSCSIGRVSTAPTSGQFSVWLGNDTHISGLIAFDAAPSAFSAAITAALTASGIALASITSAQAGTWVLELTGAGDGPQALGFAANTLDPESKIRIRAYQKHETWYHEVRLCQTPVVNAEADNESRVLPPAPKILPFRDGSTDGDTLTSEIQILEVNPEWAGTFYLTFAGRSTTTLSNQSTAKVIAAALNALYTDGKTRFLVTVPEANRAYIEFVGPLNGVNQSAITSHVQSFAPGALTFLLDFSKAQLADALRADAALKDGLLKLTLELEIQYVDADEDPDDEEVVSQEFSCQQDVFVARELHYAELGEVQPIKWLTPVRHRSYVPAGSNNVITGTQSYARNIGDGTALEYSIAHNLATRDLQAPCLIDNATGRVLAYGGEYEIEQPLVEGVPSANEVIVYCATAPTNNGLRLVLTTAGPKSAFMEGLTVTIGQVEGLEAYIEDTGATLGDIEDQLAFSTPGVSLDAGDTTFELPLTLTPEIFPGRFPKATDFKVPVTPAVLAALPPAIHVSAAIDHDFATVPTLSAAAGKVYKNTGSEVVLPGLRGHKSPVVSTNAYVGSDGRGWYLVNQSPSTKSWYAADMERELFVLPINDRMLRPGQALSLNFTHQLSTIAANTRAQFVLVIQVGSVTADTTPSPIGINLKDVVWSATPILEQQLILSAIPEPAQFGAIIRRSLSNAMTADRIVYATAEAANAGAPSTANFVVRGYLDRFDTVDTVVNPKGAIWEFPSAGSAKIA